jgi:hypothetical protein
MVLPRGSGPTPSLLVAAGKDGRMFLLNRANLGQYSPTSNNVLGTYPIGQCWCGPSYFTGTDGAGRVVTSGGQTVQVWRLDYSSTAKLIHESSSVAISSGQDPGFFTSISSNGTQAGTAVIWAVSHPTNSNPANVLLYAFDASNGAELFSAVAGTWPSTYANANIVPTVANGRVYVASNRELDIFGLGAPASASELDRISAVRQQALEKAENLPVLVAGEHTIYGRVTSVNGMTAQLRTRDGKTIPVELSEALRADHVAMPAPGLASYVRGFYRNGVLIATYVLHAKPQPALWGPDR